jgi:hypothetical protein
MIWLTTTVQETSAGSKLNGGVILRFKSDLQVSSDKHDLYGVLSSELVLASSAVDNPLIQGRPKKLKKLKDCSKKFRDKGTVSRDVLFSFIIKEQKNVHCSSFCIV